MSRLRMVLGLTLLVATAAHAQLADGSFETQGSTVATFCYFPSCPSGAWTGTSGADFGSGLQKALNPAWPASISTPDGSFYGFIQTTGSLSQTFVADASGVFTLAWLAAGRPAGTTSDFGPYGGDESYSVTLNGQSLGSFSTSSAQPFTAVSSDAFSLTAGDTYTVAFNGLTPLSTGDNTAYIDAVALAPAAVPEPATWAMMLLGFGAIGAAMRRGHRRNTISLTRERRYA